MKSCPKSTHSGGVTKKKNLAAEIGLESEEEEEEGGKENIFGRKNVPAVLKPNEQKVSNTSPDLKVKDIIAISSLFILVSSIFCLS